MPVGSSEFSMPLLKPHHIALAFVLLLAIVIWNLPSRARDGVEIAAASLLWPYFTVAQISSDASAGLDDRLRSRDELEEELRRLREENRAMAAQSNLWARVAAENGRLRQSLEWSERQPHRLTFATVIARDPANWWQSVTLDRGRRDGVAVGQAVISQAGAVGRVSTVRPKQCQVTLLGDPSLRLSATVQATQDQGFILPDANTWLDSRFIDVTYLPPGTTAAPGDKIVTSPSGGIFPSDIPIGAIVDVQSVNFGLYSTARVKLATDLGKLNHVWIITP